MELRCNEEEASRRYTVCTMVSLWILLITCALLRVIVTCLALQPVWDTLLVTPLKEAVYTSCFHKERLASVE